MHAQACNYKLSLDTIFLSLSNTETDMEMCRLKKNEVQRKEKNAVFIYSHHGNCIDNSTAHKCVWYFSCVLYMQIELCTRSTEKGKREYRQSAYIYSLTHIKLLCSNQSRQSILYTAHYTHYTYTHTPARRRTLNWNTSRFVNRTQSVNTHPKDKINPIQKLKGQ